MQLSIPSTRAAKGLSPVFWAARPNGCHKLHHKVPWDPCPDISSSVWPELEVLGLKQQRESSEPQAPPLPSYREVVN